ncbi:hypothetical protein O6P43_001342 [Quillaja saponaria]|uniref:Uncharacterized protein n=1 Tax=Quillaja saponaria TaxID=32244 RepID=A0AAD7VNW6_QUISA|nr:hypothetical protein O6P43_001342 [Quillaja saponaria]
MKISCIAPLSFVAIMIFSVSKITVINAFEVDYDQLAQQPAVAATSPTMVAGSSFASSVSAGVLGISFLFYVVGVLVS